jgi:excinuclease ABC subunit B
MSSLNSLLSKKDVIVVASVAAIYGALNPQEYLSIFLHISTETTTTRRQLLKELVMRNYSRNNLNLKPGTFRAKGDVIEIAPS